MYNINYLYNIIVLNFTPYVLCIFKLYKIRGGTRIKHKLVYHNTYLDPKQLIS